MTQSISVWLPLLVPAALDEEVGWVSSSVLRVRSGNRGSRPESSEAKVNRQKHEGLAEGALMHHVSEYKCQLVITSITA